MQEGALVAAGSEDQVVPLSEEKELKAEIKECKGFLVRRPWK